MGRGIVKLAEDEYVEWSSIVDAPVSYVVDRETAVGAWSEERVDRADRNGHSYRDGFGLEGNRAGEDERELTRDEIRERYRRPPSEGEVEHG